MSDDDAGPGSGQAPASAENPKTGFDRWVEVHGNGSVDPLYQALPGLIEVRKRHLLEHPAQICWAPKGASSSMPEPPLQVSDKADEVSLEQRIAEQLKKEEAHIQERMEKEEAFRKEVEKFILDHCMQPWLEKYGKKEYTDENKPDPEQMVLLCLLRVRQEHLREHPYEVLVPEDFPFPPSSMAQGTNTREVQNRLLFERRIEEQTKYEEAHVIARMKANTAFAFLIDKVVVDHPANPKQRRESRPGEMRGRLPTVVLRGRPASCSPLSSPRPSVSGGGGARGGSGASSPAATAGTQQDDGSGGSNDGSPRPPPVKFCGPEGGDGFGGSASGPPNPRAVLDPTKRASQEIVEEQVTGNSYL